MKRSNPNLVGDGDYLKKRLTEATAGDKAWKWKHYFENLDDDTRSKIEMDSEALFSVTRDNDADNITKLISKYLPSIASVCDGTACVGGNTISFAKHFLNVTSVEMNPERCRMLANNVKTVGLDKRVRVVNDDFLHFQNNMPYFDLIFFDPPWGGEDYAQYDSIDMFLSTKSIGEVVASLRGKTRYVALKSPSNFKLKEFEEHINATRLERLDVVISKKKQSFWVFTLYEFRSPLHGGLLHMLSPTMNPSIIQKLQINTACTWQCPSHQEVDFIANQIKSYNPSGNHLLVELSAQVGLQSLSFLSHQISKQYVLCSQFTPYLQANLSLYLPSLETPPHVHYIHADKHSLCREVPHEVKLMVAKASQVVVYVDVYSVLQSMESIWSNTPVIIDKQPLEYWLQRLVEDSCWQRGECLFMLRVPSSMEASVMNACSCFHTKVDRFEQKEPYVDGGWMNVNKFNKSDEASSLCFAHTTSLIALTPTYPANANRLSILWKPSPPCLLRRQLTSIISAVLGDREKALETFKRACAEGTHTDEEIFASTHTEFLTCCHYRSTTPWTRPLVQKVDRSVVRVYENKMKYVDAVTPRGFRPSQIVCVGGVDAHLAHELVKMYNLQQPSQALVLGEGDRRAEEQRTDYAFKAYPSVQEGEGWQDYQTRLREWAKEQLDAVNEVDMVVICCAHEVPFLGTLLLELIRHMASDAIVILNDHSIDTPQERILLEIIHDFHRQVTCTHVLPLLDHRSINEDPYLAREDKCLYINKEEWNRRLSEYGLKRVDDERSAPYWDVSDPSNLLRSFWAGFSYTHMRD